jgi:sulfoacetaldehyde dehydrogenase
VTALAWAIYEPGRARELAELAVADTGHRQRRRQGGQEPAQDLRRAARPAARPVGRVVEEDPARGIVKFAKPVGVVAAVTPSTNPAATRSTRRCSR